MSLLLTLVPQAEAQEPLTLRKNPDDPATALPTGTEVLSVQWDKSGAQSLSELGFGDRSRLRRRIEKRLENEPEKAYARVASEDGTTSRSDFEEDQIHYVLALTPQGHLYESQVGPPDNKEPGADLVVSGRMRMGPVPEAHRQTMRQAFWRAAREGLTAEGLTTRLVLEANGDVLPGGTEVRVWTTKVDSSRVDRKPSNLKRADSEKVWVGRAGKTASEFRRTQYSGKIVYAVARTPSGTLYESNAADGSGYSRIGKGGLEMTQVANPQKALQRIFQGTGDSPDTRTSLLGGWIGLTVASLLGLMTGLVTAWYYRREVRTLKTEVKRQEAVVHKLRKERSKNRSRIRSTSGSSSFEARSTRQENASGKPRRQSESDVDETLESAERPEKPLRENRRSGEAREEDSPRGEENSESRKGGEANETESKRNVRHETEGGRPSEGSTTVHEESGPSPKPTPKTPREKTGEVFARWCNEKGSLVDRFQIFSDVVEDEVEGASFRRITRDKNAAGIVFDDNAQDPVEYWLVEADGQHFLLPQPASRGFRDLECFDGANPPPSDVSAVQPALVERSGSSYELKERGKVT